MKTLLGVAHQRCGQHWVLVPGDKPNTIGSQLATVWGSMWFTLLPFQLLPEARTSITVLGATTLRHIAYVI